jgi:tRNA threonylcarbamoyladenosine biosynthesis protein TsaB
MVVAAILQRAAKSLLGRVKYGMSIILAIETSSELASCAVAHGNALYSRESNGVRTHSQAILPMVQEVLLEAGLRLDQCDAIAFGAGPGSFTGVRTACGISQGLAFGAKLPAIGMVTLDAMAQACREHCGADNVLAVLDARMGEVYWAQYHFDATVGAAGAWLTVSPPALCAPDAVAPLQAEGLVGCGNGFSAYPEALVHLACAATAHAGILPHARQLAQLGQLAFAAGKAVSAAEAQPLYLRNKIAYTSAERRDINAAKAAGAGA